MIRLLLSLLVLVSGLAVQTTPTQALVRGVHDTQLSEPAPTRIGANTAVWMGRPAYRAPLPLLMQSALRLRSAWITARPNVLIGIDRARQ